MPPCDVEGGGAGREAEPLAGGLHAFLLVHQEPRTLQVTTLRCMHERCPSIVSLHAVFFVY
eukprot:XP_001706440.1 Hypothetical protein GL50803_118670 [Giardia lamblia ATCC 50803]